MLPTMKKLLFLFLISMMSMQVSAQEVSSVQNLNRAMEMLDTVVSKFMDPNMKMAIRYKVDADAPDGTASVWDYTSAIEATCSVLEALKEMQNVEAVDYATNFPKYRTLLSNLFGGLGYYMGTYNLTSYTQNQKQWSVYGVNRSGSFGTAAVSGVMNVYDDQEWIIRELIRGYKVTNNRTYLTKAEYLVSYVLDGWDCTLNGNGEESGGITWGPGYTSKHSCSNGPLVSPLVWLSELYSGKDDKLTYYKIAADGTRYQEVKTKQAAYLDFAEKIYAYQRDSLFDASLGVYYDMKGGGGDVSYHTVNGVAYRAHVDLGSPGGTRYTYNAGTMISGGADLYRVTGNESYLTDAKNLSSRSYAYFPTGVTVNNKVYRSYPSEGFSPWFDDVLLRGALALCDVTPYAPTVRIAGNFQDNLDLAYTSYNKKGVLPRDLVKGWDTSDYYVMFQLAYASEYAMLVKYQKKNENTAGILVIGAGEQAKIVSVYDVSGQLVQANVSKQSALSGLNRGYYIVDGNKYVVK